MGVGGSEEEAGMPMTPFEHPELRGAPWIKRVCYYVITLGRTQSNLTVPESYMVPNFVNEEPVQIRSTPTPSPL